ncbi:hypothetical protein [Vulcanisaeta souniana]|uniref:Uncharacterized protein n=1 Tax=Vulcanisaeta souniana JCM 11219 TaxID=1293586 RepID=A0A830EGM7_9CREN|nr:hypothetical protein [Vulcanisaeta souniana]BDR93041.1 hypothetical protein Vsou_21340 [Vulcanisaeta souniana JCM 11219]GGI83339.1 hypothetical protein GCM10007112_20210 [Vulcanisaeta souniana JCM 11219]
MALADSLVFPDLLISITLIVVILVLTIYLVNLLMRLSMIDYKASMGTYLFIACQLGNLSGNGLSHIIIMNKLVSSNYLIICPRMAVNDSQLTSSIYVVYTR